MGVHPNFKMALRLALTLALTLALAAAATVNRETTTCIEKRTIQGGKTNLTEVSCGGRVKRQAGNKRDAEPESDCIEDYIIINDQRYDVPCGSCQKVIFTEEGDVSIEPC